MMYKNSPWLLASRLYPSEYDTARFKVIFRYGVRPPLLLTFIKQFVNKNKNQFTSYFFVRPTIKPIRHSFISWKPWGHVLWRKNLPGYQNYLLDLSNNLNIMPKLAFLSHYVINVTLKTGYLFTMFLHLVSKQTFMFTILSPAYPVCVGLTYIDECCLPLWEQPYPPLSLEGQRNKVFRDHILITSFIICFTDYKELYLILELREV